jgi:membrane associated rhomboid family serine protease
MLLAVVGFVAYHVTSAEQKEKVFANAIEQLRHLRIVVTEPGPEYEAFRDALRARTLHLIAIPAIVLISAQLFLAMRFGSTATSEPAMLVDWGASLGTLTTNGGWWRLVTSTFVYSSLLHLALGLAALVQVGRILERVVGRLTIIAVYLSAGIFTGLVNLSSHPLAVTVGTSGAVFGLYGLLIALLMWQTFHQWRDTRRPRVEAEPSVSPSKVEAAPYLQNSVLQLDRPPFEERSTAAASPADLRQDHLDSPKSQVMAEDGLPPLDESWGVELEKAEPAVETRSPAAAAPVAEARHPAVAAPVAETWHPPVDTSGPAIDTWGQASETWGQASETWGLAPETWSSAAETQAPAPEATTAVPLVAMKRIGAIAAVFLLYSMFAGFAGLPEFTGLLVGLLYGLVLARRAGEQEPTKRLIGYASAVAAVVALASAITLRNIADVKPEIARVLAIEERTAAAYQSGSDAFRKGRLSADGLAQLAERTIVPELVAADERLKALYNVPAEHQPLVADAREYLRLRCAAWHAHAAALRKTRGIPERAPGEATDASWRLQAEARFRTNRAAMGSVESADRASLVAFQRIKDASLP